MIKIYNTQVKKKEVLSPLKEGKVSMFVCGPTVYDFGHLGHARVAIFYDFLARYLKSSGYEVFYLQNITDIDDKIINRAKEKNIDWKKLASDFEKVYLKETKELRAASISKYARATEHIKEIISQVKRLIDKGYAYEIEDGIYFDIKKFHKYGKLSGRTALQAEDGFSRIDEAKGKRNKGDFCLWKFSKEGEPFWKSPFGPGRPGWHIEDTAITEKYLGFQYDIHGGGKDLIFPHHEAEIAQAESISGKTPMVKYWVHLGLLTVNGSKMSKSLNNFITIQDYLKEETPRLLRFFFLKTHYRSSVDYTDNNINQAKKELEKIDDFLSRIEEVKKGADFSSSSASKMIIKAEHDFYKSMEDDLNTPSAIAAIFKILNQANQLMNENKLSKKEAEDIYNFLKKIDKLLDFIFWQEKKEKLSKEVENLVKEREEARRNKEWEKSDSLRKEIEKSGYKVEDREKGSIVKKI